MRKILILFAALFLIASVSGEVQYRIDAEPESMETNVSVETDCSSTCPRLSWTLQEGSEVLKVKDGKGEIEDYTVSGNTIQIPGRYNWPGDERTVFIRSRIDRDAEEIYEGLYKRDISLPSFKGRKTTGFISSDNLISGRTGFGFDSSFSGEEMRFSGTGPTNIRVKFGEGYDSTYFAFFGSKPENTEVAYEVPVGTLGFAQNFDRFPVAVLPDSEYERQVNPWSDGEYVGGVIRLRNQESIEDRFMPVLAHEVVHGLNDRKLKWDSTRSSYFDEGTSKYVEFLVEKKMYNEEETNAKPAELFGEEVKYRQEEDGKTYIYTRPPKGDKEMLWNYYQEDREFMKEWSATQARDEETRRFGYAYSELIIRNFVARENGSIRELYRDLEVDREVESPEEKWSIYSSHLDMTPCEYSSRERFESCLEEINSYDYPVFSGKPSGDRKQLQIEELRVPNRTEEFNRGFGSSISGEDIDFGQFISEFLDYWISLFGDLIS